MVQALVERVANSPDRLSFPAMAIIMVATLWASLQLAGLSDNTVDLRIAPVTLQASQNSKTFCQAPAKGAAAAVASDDWRFPLYACGTAGIAGPVGPLTTVQDTGGRMMLENGVGGPSIYAVMMSNTDISGNPAVTGAEFRDGYAFSPQFVAATGLPMAAFSRRCEAGFSPQPASMSEPTPYGAGQASYAPGTPSMTPEGGMVCGDTRIVSGDLNLPD